MSSNGTVSRIFNFIAKFCNFEVESKIFKKKVFVFSMRVVGNLSTHAEYAVSRDFIFLKKVVNFYFSPSRGGVLKIW